MATEFEQSVMAQGALPIDPPSTDGPVEASPPKVAPEKALSLKELSKEEHGGAGMAPIYHIAPEMLRIEEGFNPRDISTRETYIDWLAQNIAENGVQRPLVVRNEGGVVYIVDGECRWRAALRAKDRYGAALKAIPVQLEPKGTDAGMRIARVVNIYNNSNPLTPLEQARAVARLITMGWTHENIAKNFSISRERVYQLLDIEAMPSEIKKAVKEGKISPTLAAKTIKKAGEKEGAKAILEAVEEAEKTVKPGKKAGKVKPAAIGKSRAATPNAKAILAERIQVAYAKFHCGKVVDKDADPVVVHWPKKDYATLRKALKALAEPPELVKG